MDAIREAVRELEQAGYVVRSRTRNPKGQLANAEYVIYEHPMPASQKRAEACAGETCIGKSNAGETCTGRSHAIKETRIQYESRKKRNQ